MISKKDNITNKPIQKEEPKKVDYFSLDGFNAVVAGADIGVGPEISRILAEAGASVALVGESKTRINDLAETLAQQYHVDVLPVVQDVLDDQGLKAAVDEVCRQFIGYEILVNNMGFAVPNRIQEMPRSTFLYHYDQNMSRRLEVTLSFAERGMFGYEMTRIIHVISQLGAKEGTAFPACAFYMANDNFRPAAKALAVEWAEENVTVNNLCLGIFNLEGDDEDDLFRETIRWKTPMFCHGNVENLATALLFLASPHSSFVTGIDLPIDGGFHIN